MEMAMLTLEQQEQLRQDRMNVAGTEPDCPLCGRPRVKRSDYIRCNLCATNWLEGENIMGNPKVERWQKFMQDIASTKQAKNNTAQTAPVISNA